MANFDMDAIEDCMMDMEELMADQEDIQEMMGQNFAVDYNEADLLEELNELDEEIISDQLNSGGMPSYIPQGQANAAQPDAAVANKPNEANDLEDMMKI